MTDSEREIEALIFADNVELFTKYWDEAKYMVLGDDKANVLQFAIISLSVKITDYILSKEYFDINEQSNTDDTALTYAMYEFNDEAEDIVKLIFHYYPNVNTDIFNHSGNTPLFNGVDSGIAGSFNILCTDNMREFNHKNSNGESILDKTLGNKVMFRMHTIIIAIHIKHGCDVSRENIKSIMTFIGENIETSVVWRELLDRKDLTHSIRKVAVETNNISFLP